MAFFFLSCSSCDRDTEQPSNSLRLKWEVPLEQEAYSVTKPGVAGSTVTLGTTSGEVHGFSTFNGAIKWKTRIGNSELPRNRFVASGNDFYYDYFHDTYCLNAETGAIRWRFNKPHYSSLSNPEVTDHYVLTGDGKVTQPGEASDGYLYCLDRSSGALIWETHVGERVQKIKACEADNRVYVGTRDWDFINGGDFGAFYCFDLTNGHRLWKFDISNDSAGIKRGGSEGVPAILGDDIIMTTYYGSIVCFNRITGEKKWHYNAPFGFFAGITLDPNQSRAYTIANVIYICFEPNTGSILWTKTAPHYSTVTDEPVVIGNYLYTYHIGSIRILKVESGEEVLLMNLDHPIEDYISLAVGDESLFTHSLSRLFAYELLAD